jgi:hypothetical protein
MANNGGRVQVWSCNGSPQQRWTVDTGRKSILISAGLCLDAHAPDMGNNGGRVQVWSCNNQPQQRWQFVPAGSPPPGPGPTAGTDIIRTAANMCLDTHAPDMANNGAKVQVWSCNGQPQQRWSYDVVMNAIRLSNGKCLDVHAPDMTTNGGKVQVWQCNGQPQQRWIMLPGGAIRNMMGMCLDVHAPAQTTNGGKVQVWSCNGSIQQRFVSTIF